jgi:protein gp37
LDGEIYILKKKEYKVARLFKKLMPSTWSYNYWMSVGVELNKSIKRLQREKTNISY